MYFLDLLLKIIDRGINKAHKEQILSRRLGLVGRLGGLEILQ